MPPLTAGSTSAKTTPLGYDSSDDEREASSLSLQCGPARTGELPRHPCVENDSYALAQLVIRLDGSYDYAAAQAQEYAESRAEWRKGTLIKWAELVRTGRWSAQRMERAKHAAGYT
jgi:glycerophosphoryl diester phosphodiesterase